MVIACTLADCAPIANEHKRSSLPVSKWAGMKAAAAASQHSCTQDTLVETHLCTTEASMKKNSSRGSIQGVSNAVCHLGSVVSVC